MRRDAQARRLGLDGQGIAVDAPIRPEAGQKIDPGMALEGLGDGQALGLGQGIGLEPAKGEAAATGGSCRKLHDLGAVLHQPLRCLRWPGTIPAW